MLDERSLRIVVAVAEVGSLRGAARALDVDPAVVQRTIVAAERHVGTQLFERGVGGAGITEAGQAVVRHAQQRGDLEAELRRELVGITSGAVGEVTAAVGPGFLARFGEQVLDPFLGQRPDVRVGLLTGGTDSLVRRLLHDEADLAVALRPGSHPSAVLVREHPQPVGLACHPDHPLASQHEISPALLEGERVAVLPHGFGLRNLHEALVRAHGLFVHHTLESDSLPAIVSAVARGHVVSLLPPVAVSQAEEEGSVVLVPVDDQHARAVRAGLLIRRGRRLPPAAKALLEACTTWFDQERVD